MGLDVNKEPKIAFILRNNSEITQKSRYRRRKIALRDIFTADFVYLQPISQAFRSLVFCLIRRHLGIFGTFTCYFSAFREIIGHFSGIL